VNAELMFRERGIELIRRSSPVQNSFSSLISATVSGDGKSSSASGTIIGKNMLRLVRLENFHLETYLDGHLLVFTHRDIPGIIGYVGQVLSKSNVNIAQMVVGRLQNSPGGEAIGVLNLDSRSPQAAHDEILKHPDITSVRVIDLPKQGFRPDFLG
jgi:D-3-phosphoglycerate dehydrogenase